MEQSIGIILNRSSSRADKIALLDRRYGRIDGIVYSNRVVVGALVHYTLQAKNKMYIINDMNIYEVPMHLARHDILFFHHVLELCYELIPIHSCVEGIFDLLSYLYATNILYVHRQYKKLFLFKLLTKLGIYASTWKMDVTIFNGLISIPIDSIYNEPLDLASEKELDIWLHYCITEHVHIHSLRTIRFLSKSRVA